MRTVRWVFAIFGFAALLVPALLHAGVLTFANRVMRRLGRADERAHRNRLSAWPSVWAPPVLWLTEVALGFSVEFRIASNCVDRSVRRQRPCVVISNHVTLMDMLFLAVLLRRIGRRTTRWVMAEETRDSKTLIPRICAEGGSAFIRRGSREVAVAAVRQCAGLALVDQASVILFPEGTRFRGPKPESGFRHVLPPKAGGFEVLRDVMPGFPVLSVTMQWEGGAAGTGFTSAAAYAGKRLVVHAVCHPYLSGISPGDFLKKDFARKETLLAGGLP